jgi:hypothetical protein
MPSEGSTYPEQIKNNYSTRDFVILDESVVWR